MNIMHRYNFLKLSIILAPQWKGPFSKGQGLTRLLGTNVDFLKP
jgi:hypothetical protein